MDECVAVRHGTASAYKAHKCRCPEITERIRGAQQRYHDKHRTPNLRGRKRKSDYIDEIAVERACYGDLVELAFEERTEAVRRLSVSGMSMRSIGERLGVSPRTVARHRRIGGADA